MTKSFINSRASQRSGLPDQICGNSLWSKPLWNSLNMKYCWGRYWLKLWSASCHQFLSLSEFWNIFMFSCSFKHFTCLIINIIIKNFACPMKKSLSDHNAVININNDWFLSGLLIHLNFEKLIVTYVLPFSLETLHVLLCARWVQQSVQHQNVLARFFR